MQLSDILSLLNPETAKAVQADYGNANSLFQWGPEAARNWQAAQYGVDSLDGENAINPLISQALGRGPTNPGLVYQTPLNQWLAQNEGDWGEGYKSTFRNAKYDPKYGLMLDEGSGLSNYNKETGMTPEQMAILASLAVGGIIAAPAAAGGAGGLSSLGTSTTLADMAAAGTYGPGAAGGAGGALAGGGGGGAGGIGAGAETGLGTLPQAGTWAQTAVPGAAAPLGAGAEIGSGVTTAGGGYYGGAAGAGGYSPSWTDVPTGVSGSGGGGSGSGSGMGRGVGGTWTLQDYLSLASPVVGGISSVLGANSASDAAKQAAATQQAAQDAALAEMRRQFDIGQGNLQPWLNSGRSALGQLDTLMAPGGELSQRFDLSKFQQDPGYQFQLQQGEQGVNRAAAARGGYDSGRTLKELLRFDNGLAAQSYGDAYNRYNNDQTNRYNRLAGLAGLGQTSANALTNSGNAYGNNVANTLTAGGNAQAASQIAQGNARMSGYSGIANALSGALNNYQTNTLLSQLLNTKGY